MMNRDMLSAFEDKMHGVIVSLDDAARETELLQNNKDVEFQNELQSLRYLLTASEALARTVRNKLQNLFQQMEKE